MSRNRTTETNRVLVGTNDIYRQPNVQTAVTSQADSVDEKVRKLIESGYCRHLPVDARAERIAAGLWQSRNRDIETGKPIRTQQYEAFENRVADLLKEIAGKHIETVKRDV